MSSKRPFPDWERNRPFREWYKGATTKQKNVLDLSGIHLDYFMKEERDMTWSRFNRMVTRAVKMLRYKNADLHNLLEWIKNNRDNDND